jgi:hypothetical protein
MDISRTLRGALAGATAATVWWAQQPLDMRLSGVPYDDAQMLGLAVTRGRRARPIGIAIHLANGAVFGAVYANVAPRMPLPPWARGPAAGMIEHVGSWPGVGLMDRFHPARDRIPTLGGNRAALAQAIWRHLLFGTILGELERRLNRPD